MSVTDGGLRRALTDREFLALFGTTFIALASLLLPLVRRASQN